MKLYISYLCLKIGLKIRFKRELLLKKKDYYKDKEAIKLAEIYTRLSNFFFWGYSKFCEPAKFSVTQVDKEIAKEIKEINPEEFEEPIVEPMVFPNNQLHFHVAREFKPHKIAKVTMPKEFDLVGM